jgi:hypothetical protein
VYPDPRDHWRYLEIKVGTLEDGTVFDDTRARHEPYTFRVGLGFVIGGWDKGIPTMMKGQVLCDYGSSGLQVALPFSDMNMSLFLF